MSGWFDVWHSLTPGQGTLLGGAFVLVAGIISFGTGSLDRRSQQKRFHYEEIKRLYAEALRVGRDLEILKALPPEIRREVLTEKADAIDRLGGALPYVDVADALVDERRADRMGYDPRREFPLFPV
jgi:hypothetical protein